MEGVDRFKWELDRYLDAMEIEGSDHLGILGGLVGSLSTDG